MAVDPNETINPERFSAILENQRAIMVNQATILHNQNKIMRGMEQLFSFFPTLQGSYQNQGTLSAPVSVTPITSILNSSENSRVEQPPSTASQLPADQTSNVPRVENTTPINTPTRPQAPLNSNTPTMIGMKVKAMASSGDSSPGSDNETDVVSAPPVGRKVLPEYISQEELNQIKCKSCSIGNFAVQLLRHIFDHTELENRNCTGTRGKEPVDPDRLRFVKDTVYDVYGISSDEKINTWKHCIRAIDEYLRRPKRMAKGGLNKTAMF
ncbi:BEN domain-containing protein 3 [Acropora cervicornis]|uniref:BEN domain-containing protein 3 n=1 Tax=Acropora cervicornis TaxID=6130 RepID=A0AAD9PV15_ACRCE|nr:PREDICTED: uncharacterized protein LOC107346020 [Acropora digitifera]KAK2549599.1 BEN domain-containing protein 3 [Acropora cervicornis]